VSKQITRFILDESGLEMVEWAIVGGLVVAIGAAFFTLIGENASVGIEKLSDAASKVK